MFRIEDNVPEAYVRQSRDFQLFCRLYDLCFAPVKQQIDSMQLLTDTKQCSHQTLELLKTKLGLFTKTTVGDKELRYLLMAFPFLLRYKGSTRGVQLLLTLYTHMYPGVTMPEIVYPNDYTLRLIFTEAPKNDRLLLELLELILPTGYIVTYFVGSKPVVKSQITTKDAIQSLRWGITDTAENEDFSKNAKIGQSIVNITEIGG